MLKHSLFAALLCGAFFTLSPGPVAAQAALGEALRLSARGEWDAARTKAAEDGAVAADLLTWQWLRAGKGAFADYESFWSRRPDWPGLPLLHEKGEAAAAKLAEVEPARILAYFTALPPRTGEGALALARAQRALGQEAAALETARNLWLTLPFDAESEAALLSAFPQVSAADHAARMDHLLWEGRKTEAKRLLPHLSEKAQKLAALRLALAEDAPGVSAQIAALSPAEQADPGLAYARFDYRMRRDLYPEAIELLRAQSTAPEGLGRPEAWAERRALLARRALREGRAAEAYELAATHHLPPGNGASAYADLEFLAGFIALRGLNDPARALPHFKALEAVVETPISQARAFYWKARALEAAGAAQDALIAYQSAASFQTAYYGLLAAEHLGLPLDPSLAAPPPLPDWQGAPFVSSSVFEAGLLLLKAGDRTQAKRFWLHLAEGLDTQALAQLSGLALSAEETHLALVLAKAAAERGAILPAAYFPRPAALPGDLAVEPALALAIARRESEFDPAARSHADARGLMQLLPGTGADMARTLGVAFKPSDLTADPALNMRLGSAYLAKMQGDFGPALALVAAGYNAGPSRPRRWISELGDPRQTEVDIVDWVEMIPFTETRTYVMRVAEGVVLYRAQAEGQPGPIALTALLRGR